MRGLAEYAMHGRRQAIIVVLMCGFFPMLYFVSAAIVGLVNLRKGWYEGLLILIWSLLPAMLLWRMGDTTPVILMLGATILSQLLRKTQSWQQVILIATFLGVLTQISLYWQTEYVQSLQAIFSDVVEAQAVEGVEVSGSADQMVNLLLRFYGAYHVIGMVLCVVLARWWQAALYNPGGFQQEFHQLRLGRTQMLVLLVLMLGGLLGVAPLDQWLAIFSIPPMFSGIALMHCVVALKKMSSQWLILCYLTLVVMPPAVIALGLLDAVMNLRKRVAN